MARFIRKREHLPPEEWVSPLIEGKVKVGRYEVSNHGKVRRLYMTRSPRLLRPYWKSSAHHGSDYKLIKLYGKEYRLSKVIWEAFNGKLHDGKYLIHANMDKDDNTLWNLKPITKHELGKLYGELSRPERHKTIARINRNGEIIETYRSAKDAAKKYPMSDQAILDRCNGRIKKPWLPDDTTFIWEE